MLIRREVLEGIAEGRVDLAVRRWSGPRVGAGSLLRLRMGGPREQDAVAAGRRLSPRGERILTRIGPGGYGHAMDAPTETTRRPGDGP